MRRKRSGRAVEYVEEKKYVILYVVVKISLVGKRLGEDDGQISGKGI